MATPHPCPICKRSVEPSCATTPFCSSRCRLIDLGEWLGDGYRIVGEAGDAPERTPSGEGDED